MTMTAPKFTTVRAGSSTFTATRMRRTCGVCSARTMRRTVNPRRTLTPAFSFVNCGRRPLRPLTSASSGSIETRLSRTFTNRRTSRLSTWGRRGTSAPVWAPSACRTPSAIVTCPPKRFGWSLQRRSPYTSRTGVANAGRSAAWACSFDIPPTGTPARVTPGWINAGGAASPRRAGASAATTRTDRARRRTTWTKSYSGSEPLERRGEQPQRRPSGFESLGDTSPGTKTEGGAEMDVQELEKVAGAIVADGKGILAADESSGTIKKRFDSIGVESTEETRRAYRELLFTTDGAEEFIGGVILFDETIRQQASDGTPFPELLASKGIIPGTKVDTGAHDLAQFPGEKVTEGLDGLRG